MRFLTLLILLTISFKLTTAQEVNAIFGDTTDIDFSLKGNIYFLPKNTRMLPDFNKYKVQGTIYTTKLDISPRPFDQGFPGIKNRFEWFGIQYTGRFYIAEAGNYYFSLKCDDGAMLYIDNELIIDGDGRHKPLLFKGETYLKKGNHKIKVDYFQGPANFICLELKVKRKAVPWEYFNTRKYAPFQIVENDKSINIVMESSILFAHNSDELSEKATDALLEAVPILKKYAKRRIVIAGHTDSSGSAQYNYSLSVKRAKSVNTKLQALGVNTAKFKVIGYGEKKPLLPNNSEKNRCANRRVEIEIKK